MGDDVLGQAGQIIEEMASGNDEKLNVLLV